LKPSWNPVQGSPENNQISAGIIIRAILISGGNTMKFLCNTEFYHSGKKLYVSGMVYVLTALLAQELIALDKKKPLGALSFFTPVDEEAVNFIKGKSGEEKPAAPKVEGNTTPAGTDAENTNAPKEPTKAELIQEAKALGIKATTFMSIEHLKEVIAAAKKAQSPAPTGTDAGEEITELAPADGADASKE
jgi:hypothetical protein